MRTSPSRSLSRALVWSLAVIAGSAAAQPAHYDITITIEPATRAIAARATISVEGSAADRIALAREHAAEYLLVDGKPIAAAAVERDGRRLWPLQAARSKRTVEVRWHGTVAPLDRSLDHRETLVRPVAVAGVEGTFLPSGSFWYPVVAGPGGPLLASYRVTLDLPAGQRGVAPGRLVEEKEDGGRHRATFEFAHPAEGIDLMAGPYRVESRTLRTAAGSTVELRTYFQPSIAELAAGYLDSLQAYLDLYERWIGPYPFTEFSVVSSPTPTGFGMPTLAYLGETVLKLPFIRSTSLGHEVLHNWWGNGVYPDFRRGNWSEGLTTFMADYAYKEQAGAEAAREMRLGWLRDLAAVPPGEDRPLVEFTARTHGTSQIVGYNKAAMIFLMLRDALGEEKFDAGVRRFWAEQRFRIASWRDLQRAFEAESGRELAPFFAQWLERAGVPAVRISDASRRASGEGHSVRLTLEQGAPGYALRVPVLVRTERRDETHVFDLGRERQSFSVALPARPTALILDPEFRLLRRLAADETPAILRQLMVAPRAAVAVAAPAEWRAPARRLAERVSDAKPRELVNGETPPADAALLVVGRHDTVDAWLAAHDLPARPEELAAGANAQAWAVARPGGAPLAVVSARDVAALETLARLLPHYGRQSFLVVEGRQVVKRGVWPSQAVGWRFE